MFVKDVFGNKIQLPNIDFICYNVDKKRKEGIYIMNFEDPEVIQMGIRLAEVAAKNTSSLVFGKIKAFKSNKNKDETISGMQELIRELLDEKQEIEMIAKSYQEELVAQKLTENDLDFVVKTIIPSIKKSISKSIESGKTPITTLESIDEIEPLISLNTLMVLQTLGFNYKKAIGEPLTNLVGNAINKNINGNSDKLTELATEREIEYFKLLQNEEAFNRLQQFH